MTSWLKSCLVLFPLLLLSCTPDYGVQYSVEEVVIEEVIEEIIEEIIEETVGESILDQGYIYNQAIDILFIVDESGSMANEHDVVRNYLPDMHSVLIGPDFSDLDWRVMLRSADPDDEHYGWVSWDDANAEYKLNALFSTLDTRGAGESGLDTAIQSTAFDDDFHREEADLLIIFVSDEPDQSGYSVSAYEGLIATYKIYPFQTTEAAIVYSEDDSTVYPECSTGDIGTGYIDVSEQVVSFCDPTAWGDILLEAKEHVPTLNEKWLLSDVPYNEDSIRVFSDTEEWFDWYYDSVENAIYLTVIPEVGTLISIIYVVEPIDTGT
tara:strand:- start:688 stop:1656 length:969 start_codon:yes stop_codon:yes gene_type:complete